MYSHIASTALYYIDRSRRVKTHGNTAYGMVPSKGEDPVYDVIRASVDALRRDGTSEISRDPRTKRLQTRRESLARPSKHTNNNF